MSSMSKIDRLRSSASVQRKVGIGIRLIVAFFLIIFSIFPILWVVSASLNSTGTLATQTLIPAKPSLDNYRTLLTTNEFPFWTWFWNSIKIASITSVLSLSITTIAAYAFSRFRFRGRQTMLKGIMLINVFPALLALVATFLMISQIGDVLPFIGLDNHTSLILVYLGGAMGINIWLMKGFIDVIPEELVEAAKIDGCSNFGILRKVIIPLCISGLVSVGILIFIDTWNELLFASALAASTGVRPITTTMTYFYTDAYTVYGWMTAAGTVGVIPAVIFVLFFQKYIVKGVMAGAVKG